MLATSLVFLAVCGVVSGQLPNVGRCPQLETQPDFDKERYFGRWHEIMRYGVVLFELGTKCVIAEYSDLGDNTIQVNNTARNIWRRGGYRSAIGTARIVDPDDPGKLAVRFDSNPFGTEGAYWVLSTDYDTYSIVYSCSEYSLFNYFWHADIIWILGRGPQLQDDVKEQLLEDIKRRGLRANRLLDMDQSCYID